MKLSYKHLIPDDFHPESKVWIYQCNRMFGMMEALQIEEKLNSFVADWKSHGAPKHPTPQLYVDHTLGVFQVSNP